MAFARMTIAIASYQRRLPLLRLLRALDKELAASPELRRDLEIVVVLDGSTDGSLEAVEAETWSVPVHVHWQRNRGLAAVRNVGLHAAEGGIVWFLDDDVVPSAGLVERHRRAHDRADRRVVVGPCRIPSTTVAAEEVLGWWESFHSQLRPGEDIDRYELFTAANASGPASVFVEVGGFDESFDSYGLEDYELAVRLLEAGVRLSFDAEAVAWHPELEPLSVHVARERGIGLNSARTVHLHPATLDLLFPTGAITPSRRLIGVVRLRRPASLMALSRLAYRASRLTGCHVPTSRRAEHLARSAAYAAGVAEGDRSGVLLDRVLGYSSRRASIRRRWRSRARASRQPFTSPTSKDPTISR